MISFSKLGKLGRLGNQLFQIASTMGIAERNGTTAAFPAWKYAEHFEPIPTGPTQPTEYKEQQYHYTDYIVRDVDLHGYFQSAKFFPKQCPIKFKNQTKVFNVPTIGIHIRRGDYVGHPEYYQLPITWYISALLSIPDWQKYKVVIVSDDVPYCRVHFECLPDVHFANGTDVDDLRLFSQCDWQIMSNSSFSWWGAFLSKKQQCIHSGKLFRGEYAKTKNIKDFYQPNWTTHEYEKLDIDATFTIPVYHDHPDRKKNLDMSLCVLQSHFNADFIIGEQGGDSFKYTEQWATYVKFDLRNFHRTKMLNDMANMASTKYVINWDADIFIPPMQIMLSILSGAVVSYPYDGRFARMERQAWCSRLEKALDIGIVGNAVLSGKGGRPVPETSVGGVVIWDKDTFIDAGMENENMISFGPENVERYERMKMLGLEIHRSGGCLYHLNHFVGPDSSKANPFFKANHAELEKMRKMNGHQMREYIDTWPWRNQYTGSYYEKIKEGAIRSANATYDVLKMFTGKDFRKLEVIDVGCGIGEWSCENKKYHGIDHGVDKRKLMISNYVDIDLNKGIQPQFKHKFDLAICLEVAEHLKPESADMLVRDLCAMADYVLFGAAIPFQGGTGHINEQWQTYWAEKFYANGFGAEICYPVKDNPAVEMWYRQNMVLYKRGAKGVVHNFVLPEYYLQIIQHFKNLSEEKRGYA